MTFVHIEVQTGSTTTLFQTRRSLVPLPLRLGVSKRDATTSVVPSIVVERQGEAIVAQAIIVTLPFIDSE